MAGKVISKTGIVVFQYISRLFDIFKFCLSKHHCKISISESFILEEVKHNDRLLHIHENELQFHNFEDLFKMDQELPGVIIQKKSVVINTKDFADSEDEKLVFNLIMVDENKSDNGSENSDIENDSSEIVLNNNESNEAEIDFSSNTELGLDESTANSDNDEKSETVELAEEVSDSIDSDGHESTSSNELIITNDDNTEQAAEADINPDDQPLNIQFDDSVNDEEEYTGILNPGVLNETGENKDSLDNMK